MCAASPAPSRRQSNWVSITNLILLYWIFGWQNGGLGTDIPARLKSQGHMGVLYASGDVGQMALTSADGEALIVKPYRSEDIIRALRIVEQIISIRNASRSLPKGFSILKDAPKGDTAQISMMQASLNKTYGFAGSNRSLRDSAHSPLSAVISTVYWPRALVFAPSVCAFPIARFIDTVPRRTI